jgi:hypothetical protein
MLLLTLDRNALRFSRFYVSSCFYLYSLKISIIFSGILYSIEKVPEEPKYGNPDKS